MRINTRRAFVNIVLVIALVFLAAAGVYAITNLNLTPSSDEENYLLTISEISDQHELSAPENAEADRVMLYELPVGSVISLTAKTEGISHQITCYNERNRKIDSFTMSLDGYGRGERKELEAGETVSYAVTYSDIDYAFMSIDITEGEETISYFFRVVKAEAPQQSEDAKVELIVTAIPTGSKVLVDGEPQEFLAYNINDYNYFRLRDIAAVLTGTEKQFNVEWDAKSDSILLTTGKYYTMQKGDLEGNPSAENKTGLATQSTIYVDGEEVALVAYNIDGNNYFKLGDLGKVLNFGVDWDPDTKSILIDSHKDFTE
jgi:hypothetical protein